MPFTTMPAAGTIGYHAAINRPSRSRALECRTGKFPTRAEAVTRCLELIRSSGTRVKPSDTITTYQWTASETGSWECVITDINKYSETMTIPAARAAQLQSA